LNENRRLNMQSQIGHLAAFRPVRGATVLEIGADSLGVAAGMPVEAGASHLLSTNFAPNWSDEPDCRLERRRRDHRRLGQDQTLKDVDIVFGVAVLELRDGLADSFAGVTFVATA
jgi:hypothetical protein